MNESEKKLMEESLKLVAEKQRKIDYYEEVIRSMANVVFRGISPIKITENGSLEETLIEEMLDLRQREKGNLHKYLRDNSEVVNDLKIAADLLSKKRPIVSAALSDLAEQIQKEI